MKKCEQHIFKADRKPGELVWTLWEEVETGKHIPVYSVVVRVCFGPDGVSYLLNILGSKVEVLADHIFDTEEQAVTYIRELEQSDD